VALLDELLLDPVLVPEVELPVRDPLVPPLPEEDVPLLVVFIVDALGDEADEPPVLELVLLVPFDSVPVVGDPFEPLVELGEHVDSLVVVDPPVTGGSVGTHMPALADPVAAGTVEAAGPIAAPPPLVPEELDFLSAGLVALVLSATAVWVFSTVAAAVCTTAAVDGMLAAAAYVAGEAGCAPGAV
jgi:hypothetical protein